MLPFLKRDQEVGSASGAIKPRKPDENPDHESMTLIVEELIHAIHAHDTAGAKEALHAAFQLFDSEPHEEGPHG